MTLVDHERPKETPDGLPFPYSHFGIERQRKLLRNIAEKFGLDPKVILNMGCGYDTSLSDVFPDARVVYVDRAIPDYIEDAVDIVVFLKKQGYEAYTRDELPEGLQADLGMSILGPGIDPGLISPDGIFMSTSRNVPDGMQIIGLVQANDEHTIVNDYDSMVSLWDSGGPIHLVISQKIIKEE